jgi:hypothetical protein
MRFMQVTRALREGISNYQMQAGQPLPTRLVSLDIRRKSTACCKGRGAVSNLLQRVRCEWNKPWRGDILQVRSASHASAVADSCRYYLIASCCMVFTVKRLARCTRHCRRVEATHILCIQHTMRDNKTKGGQQSDDWKNKARTIQPPRIKIRMLDNCGLSLRPTVLSL